MAPNPKRNRCVVLYDLNSQNQRELRQALIKVFSEAHFNESKDLVNLVLVNSKITKNRKNLEAGKGYENIFEVNREGQVFDPTIVHEKIEVPNTNTANWKEALRVAVDILVEDETPGIVTYQILYLTDLSTSSEPIVKVDIEDIIEDLNIQGLFLYFVGPAVTYPRIVTSFDDLKSLVQDISFDRTNENLNEAHQIVRKSNNAVIADVKMGLHFFFNYKNRIGKQPWTVPLTVGTKISYAVETTKFMETSDDFVLVEKDEEKVTKIFVSVEDSTKIYPSDDVRQGVVKHGKFIPLENNDIFKEKLDRMFSLVFITKIESIPEYMMTGPGCYSVAATKNGSPEAFQALLLKLDELQSCIIAKRVYNKGCAPVYMALIPLISKNCFRAVQLSYGSNCRYDWVEQEPKKVEMNESDPVFKYLDQITVGSNNFSLTCAMTPNVISSPTYKELLNYAAGKLLNDSTLNLNEIELDPFETGLRNEVGRELREIWPSGSPAEEEDDEDQCESDNDEDYDEFF